MKANNSPDIKESDTLNEPPVPHYPGQSLDKQLEQLSENKIGWVAITIIFGLIALYEWAHYFGMPPQPIPTSIIAIALGAYSYNKIQQIDKEYKNKSLGSFGEKQVGEVLNNIPIKTYHRVFHDIVSKSKEFNIDHVLVSEHGYSQ